MLNPLGQVIQQESPVQRAKKISTGIDQSTKMHYDDLGRMDSRTETDLISKWVYDQPAGPTTCSTLKSCGKLVESYTLAGALKSFQQSHSYDSLSRPSSTVSQLDTSYTHSYQYDSWGRPLAEQHQRANETAKVFERRYNAYGYQYQVLRGSLILWQATEQDAAQRIKKITLGNGLNIARDFYANTGRLQSSSLMNASNISQPEQLREGYTYDTLGNVAQRTQYWADTGFIENFTYDDLNRLKSGTVTGYATQNFNYDAIGNILNKTGTGTGDYVYLPSGAASIRPHAVDTIPGIGKFNYDANGNLLNGAGRTLSWTSFDMPAMITKTSGSGTESSSFVYGPDHQRIKQTKQDGSIIYYAGAMEIETLSGTVQSQKTYWPNGLGVEIDKPLRPTDLNWTHQDRIGSIVAISDASGNIVEKLAYDSWGKRRGLNGADDPTNVIDGIKDNKGFTGHEMLDKLDLVHMNGRVYDPLVARFMSADPFIQDPEHSQSYNRYTYVWNNPTNLTDPTGFVAAMESSIAIQNCAQSVGCQTDGRKVNWLDGSDEGQGNHSTESPPSSSGDKSGTGNTNKAPTIAQIDARVKDWDWKARDLSIVNDIMNTVQAAEKIKILKDGDTYSLNANVTIKGFRAAEIAEEVNAKIGKITLTDDKGRTLKTNIVVTVVDKDTKADIVVNQISTESGRSNGSFGVININTFGKNNNGKNDPGVGLHEFGHAFFWFPTFLL